ncbi:proline-rich protein 18 [Macrotis lagotis]|uniref:proline-rich protein 18 n=1 Tax=Macrotis lagotis TaxID=92651 RepID=UPI003D69EAFE
MPFPPVQPPPPPPPGPGAAAPPRRPAAAGEKKRRPPERPETLVSGSWPSATLKRPVAGRAPGRPPPPPAPRPPPPPARAGPGPARSCESLAAGGPAGPEEAVRFSLSLTPEALLVIQRRHLEKQLLARPRRPFPSPAADTKRLLASCPRAKAAPPRRGRRRPGERRPAPPRSRSPPVLPGAAPALGAPPRAGAPPGPGDLRTLLKISLLNEHHKYDDVEYEEEAEAVDEGLVRKCTEWLRGVESAAAARDRAEALETLPHLGTL